ncbi:MAG: Holliday junction branch migration protein RuvA [Candidatus Vogelbacteria bacterium]|nr:Holliday junction branch migration protein RuvA [Candidatus Vogelbacteria bacterium]
MISQLKGKITFANDKFVVLDVSGVGYRVNLTSTDLAELAQKDIAQNQTFWTHLAVREDSMELYGFINKNELDFFELLISISGIGPRKALGILSVAPVETLKKALRSRDTSYLTQVSGIGKKNAEKIVLELKDKFAAIESGEDFTSLREESDAVAAIKSLGYSSGEARDALQKVNSSITKLNDRIKEALKNLGK